MKTNHLLVMLLLGAPVLFGAVFLACGGDVAIGKGSAGLSKDGPKDENGALLCPLSDCAHQGMACGHGAPRNLRCVDLGQPYAEVGDRCILVGECVGDSDAGTCPRECESFPMTGACALGDICRKAGDALGREEATCLAGSDTGRWQWESSSFADPACDVSRGADASSD